MYSATVDETVLISIAVDYFLVTASTFKPMDCYHTVLSKEDAFKRLRRPTKFLGWSISYSNNGFIFRFSLALMMATISKADMTVMDGRHIPYDCGADIVPPNENYVVKPHMEAKFLRIVDHLLYLACIFCLNLGFMTEILVYAAGTCIQRGICRQWNL